MTEREEGRELARNFARKLSVRDSLPYTLSAGVVATEAGLEIDDPVALAVFSADRTDHGLDKQYEWAHMDSMLPGIIPWPTVAERLRYRESEPWCYAELSKNRIICRIDSGYRRTQLHRLAAILCDDAAAFRVLHACIQEHNHE